MSKLYIVGTPIGNLKDLTFRALETLQKVDVIACEDTRVTSKLLAHYNIEGKKLIKYDNFNEKNSSKGICKLIVEQNLDVALVSDAGMPVMSDPGFELIRSAKNSDIDVELIPGVNAAISAFVMSSLDNTFTFLGFIKDKINSRKIQLESLAQGTYIFYVSPHKLLETLKNIDETIPNNQVFLAKELTKLYEHFYSGSAYDIHEELSTLDAIKGEYTLVLKIPKTKKNKYKNQ
ncbi:16S rRNA (cytidine(1402)-2'-O)-methyltransferase [Mycoplasmopsis ciconiae]|uniref:Ribosomal RNA small subunit methyltransferase I n=1 Tax=Mycoplasmopsis ciconiae TaxID=561067 RepID=A0ABU7MLZ5_9BACT|nr:16S rRNA (cytidine(1402)-2'-O)-methyltransferase [Mycoplasmopsis ciconiae]